MIYRKRFSILLFVILILFTILGNISFASSNKKVLILGSYNIESEWEQSIIEVIKNNLKNVNIRVEFLDAVSYKSEIYNDSFMKVLNLKYIEDNIDCILTIDDEALNFARQNLFNKESFMYEKPIVFVGINNYINLNENERKYMTGIIEYQDNLVLLDNIIKLSKNINEIYVIMNNSIFGKPLESNLLEIENLTYKPIDIKIIKADSFDKIEDKIKEIPSSSAILLCGINGYILEEDFFNSKNIVDRIKSITNVPIYTNIEHYVREGAIGGIVNDGQKIGRKGAILVEKVLNNKLSGVVNPDYNNYITSIFNYKSLREYNINPLLLPEHSIVINKGPFDLLVPKYMEIIIWAIVGLGIISIIVLIYLFILNKKKVLNDKDHLNESIERNEIKTDFILTISHELRTPLNIIINANKLLKLRVYAEKYDKDFFNKQINLIDKNSNRLLRLINNLIDVSKIETGYIDTIFKNENIVDVIEDVTMSVVDLANSYNIEIIFDTEEEEIITAIDRSKIEKIMLNLLSNSIKFTNSGGHIFVNVKKSDSDILIEVIDDGIGMSEELQAHLFEKFRKAKIYPALEGANERSGLGMFIVKGLVNRHSGTIEVDSKVNEGTKFTIKIPQVFVDQENPNYNSIGMPLDYISKIELSDIYKKDE